MADQSGDEGSIIYAGTEDWSDYTLSFEATKTDGKEGFFIPFSVNDSGMFYWNIGGYGNTLSCLQERRNGVKTGQLEWTIKPFAAER